MSGLFFTLTRRVHTLHPSTLISGRGATGGPRGQSLPRASPSAPKVEGECECSESVRDRKEGVKAGLTGICAVATESAQEDEGYALDDRHTPASHAAQNVVRISVGTLWGRVLSHGIDCPSRTSTLLAVESLIARTFPTDPISHHSGRGPCWGKRHPFRHLAPLAGAWGLAPTLPNYIDLESIAGNVPADSDGPLPLVIGLLPCLAAGVTRIAGGTGYVGNDAGSVVELLNVSAWSTSGCRVPDG